MGITIRSLSILDNEVFGGPWPGIDQPVHYAFTIKVQPDISGMHFAGCPKKEVVAG